MKFLKNGPIFQEKNLKNGYPSLPKSPLKMGRGFEARAAHPCPTQIWVTPPPPPGFILLIFLLILRQGGSVQRALLDYDARVITEINCKHALTKTKKKKKNLHRATKKKNHVTTDWLYTVLCTPQGTLLTLLTFAPRWTKLGWVPYNCLKQLRVDRALARGFHGGPGAGPLVGVAREQRSLA